MSTLYIPLSADLEIQVTVSAREANGIDTDPGVIERAATAEEALRACRLLAASLAGVHHRSQIEGS